MLRRAGAAPVDVGGVLALGNADVVVLVAGDAGRMELEGRVVPRRVVDDEVEDDADAGVVTSLDERLEVLARTEVRRRCRRSR